MIRKRIYSIIEKAEEWDKLSRVYDAFMLIVIIASIVPIAIKEQSHALIVIDQVCAWIFIVDYIARWSTADMKLKGKLPFLRYPITPMAIIDLLAILPSFSALNSAFRVLKILRSFKAFRIFKTFRYSKNFVLIAKVIRKNASILLSILISSVFYILVSALFIFSVEPESFNNFFEATYWATTALTTFAYGDIYPHTDAGRLISMISSFLGIAMVALPAGVITAGFMKETQDNGGSKANHTTNNS